MSTPSVVQLGRARQTHVLKGPDAFLPLVVQQDCIIATKLLAELLLRWFSIGGGTQFGVNRKHTIRQNAHAHTNTHTHTHAHTRTTNHPPTQHPYTQGTHTRTLLRSERNFAASFAEENSGSAASSGSAPSLPAGAAEARCSRRCNCRNSTFESFAGAEDLDGGD
jgi:hypothetical protein